MQKHADAAGVLARIITRYGFMVSKVFTGPDGSVAVNFYDPRLGDDIYYYSSVFYDPGGGRLEATVHALMTTGHKEFYLDYCVEDGRFVCRPHVWREDSRVILSIQAVFHDNPLERLKALLNEYSPFSM